MVPRALLLAVLVPVTATVATAEPAEPRDLMARSLARCCGEKRATLGPLFGNALDECGQPPSVRSF